MRVRSDRYDKIIFLGFLVYRSENKRLQNSRSETNMMENILGAIGFTRGFSQDSKYYGG